MVVANEVAATSVLDDRRRLPAGFALVLSATHYHPGVVATEPILKRTRRPPRALVIIHEPALHVKASLPLGGTQFSLGGTSDRLGSKVMVGVA
jgi:hypothetical protein